MVWLSFKWRENRLCYLVWRVTQLSLLFSSLLFSSLLFSSLLFSSLLISSLLFSSLLFSSLLFSSLFFSPLPYTPLLPSPLRYSSLHLFSLFIFGMGWGIQQKWDSKVGAREEQEFLGVDQYSTYPLSLLKFNDPFKRSVLIVSRGVLVF